MRFFYPNVYFWQWLLAEHRDDCIIDIGCGAYPHLVEAGCRVGLRMTGIDPQIDPTKIPYDILGAIIPQWVHNVPDIVNNPNVVNLLCRPCHGSFCLETANMTRKCKALYYIGLESNIECDWWDGGTDLDLIASDVGDDGEKIWKVTVVVPHKFEDNNHT